MLEAIEYFAVVDKGTWARGEWDAEPDKKQWEDAQTGLPCLIVRHEHHGYLCGYVGVSPGHPLYGVDWKDEPAQVLPCNVNFSRACEEEAEREPCRWVCHVAPPEAAPVWWFGFDCGHVWDLAPGLEAVEEAIMPPDLKPSARRARFGLPVTYRNLQYAQELTEELARDLVEMAKP